MSRFDDQLPAERVTALDINLRQRFGYRRADLQARLSRRRKQTVVQAKNGLFSTSGEVDASASGTVFGGLEVYTATAYSVTVSKGAMLLAHPGGSPGSITRPLTFSGKFDADDDALGLYELAADTVVAASGVPTPIAAVEWWAVVVAPELHAVEADSARKVFDKTPVTGGDFDAASVNKVFHRRLVPSIVRGTGGGSIASVTIPSGSVVIAWLYVHAVGESNLNNALAYDARRMPDPMAQNRVGGHWVAKDQVLTGEWHATLQGEAMSVRAATSVLGSTTLPFAQIAEPGATWPASGVAYLYLCRVRGTVPRLRGTLEETDSIAEFTSFEVAGALVLSPTPPRSFPDESVSASGASQERFDLRNASTLVLPNPTHTPGVPPLVLAMKFGGGASADEALCVGLFPYESLSGGLPRAFDTVLLGPRHFGCSADGWVAGDVDAIGSTRIATTSFVANTGTGAPEATFTVANSIASKRLPVSGFQVTAQFRATDATNGMVYRLTQVPVDASNTEPVSLVVVGSHPVFTALTDYDLIAAARAGKLPTAATVKVGWTVRRPGGGAVTYAISVLSFGYRLPYGVDLHTPA